MRRVRSASKVADSISTNAHRAVQHNYGNEADSVAHGESLNSRTASYVLIPRCFEDVGKTANNVGAATADATLVTSAYKHGYDAGKGAVDGYKKGE